VTLTAPVAGATFNSSLMLAANAADDKGVVKVVFSIDGTAVATDTSAPWTTTWKPGRRVAYGQHVVKATAYDAAGLTAAASTTVTRVH
jgi:hypothetical protein